MGQWSRAEREDACEKCQRHVEDVVATGEWERFADLFTEDAVYTEHVYGTFHGRDEIRQWIVRTMTTFPGSSMVAFPPRWSVIDEERGWIVCEIRNIMADPGDGSVHEEPNITILRYAGDGLFAEEEDVYNPARQLPMVLAWAKRAQEHGTLPAGSAAWMAAYAG